MNRFINDFSDIRKNICNAVREEILGPGSEQTGIAKEVEIITDKPSKRYSTGILFSKMEKENENLSKRNDLNEENYLDSEIEDKIFEIKKDSFNNKSENEAIKETIDEAEEFDDNINNAYVMLPSSMGMTFFIDRDIKEIFVCVKGARYRAVRPNECMVKYEGEYMPLELSELKNIVFYEAGYLKLKERLDYKLIKKLKDQGYFQNFDSLYLALSKLASQSSRYNHSYKRVPLELNKSIKVEFKNDKYGKTRMENQELSVFALKRRYKDRISITIMLVNESVEAREESYLFQPEILVDTRTNNFCYVNYQTINENREYTEKELKLEMLYRNKVCYATGHGVSVDYSGINIKCGKGILKSEYIPMYEVPSMNFNMKEISTIENKVLPMINLSTLSKYKKDEIISLLSEFVELYKIWINKIKEDVSKLNILYVEVAKKHIKECEIACERMNNSIGLLEDHNIFKAFQLANQSMLIQRVQSINPEIIDNDNFNIDSYRGYDKNKAKWRGFQLAFLLMSIGSLSNCEDEYRNTVDLIWIPTGGGKTEAYLGVSAFTIFYRRLTCAEKAYGTTIIMRYTLRLLAAQQFIRASILICACEFIRRNSKEPLGKEPITIGLWIGSGQTPNSMKSAKVELKNLKSNYNVDNKFQLLKCPWCGSGLTKIKGDRNSTWGYRIKKNEFIFECSNQRCEFQMGLPVQIIDECLYKKPPTLLFSTVDKFAMATWKGEVGNFFGINSENMAPELIIQDELHLISGPLGSLVGLYETSIDYLCSKKGRRPKIIASTATICEADEQVQSLYTRDVKQFPPPALNIEDSYFTREVDVCKKPGRLYMGITGIGQTITTTEIRIFASLLQRIDFMSIKDEQKDKYWTLVSYFNSIRELGKASTLVDDDVKDYMIRISNRVKSLNDVRRVYTASELTSRVASSEIIKTLDKLEVKYPDKKAINMLLATNMISVGVDVPRLNLMTVIGQPKLTSEYIQASSRVGRNDPGLVVTLYDGRKSRDKSHYEIFTGYHQAFYKYVEPTSITSFSEPTIDRALHAAFISMIRHSTVLNDEKSANYFSEDLIGLEEIKKFIIERANGVDSRSEKYVENKLNELIQIWIAKTNEDGENSLSYTKGHRVLLRPFLRKSNDVTALETMQSMRNVDGEIGINIYEKEQG